MFMGPRTFCLKGLIFGGRCGYIFKEGKTILAELHKEYLGMSLEDFAGVSFFATCIISFSVVLITVLFLFFFSYILIFSRYL